LFLKKQVLSFPYLVVVILLEATFLDLLHVLSLLTPPSFIINTSIISPNTRTHIMPWEESMPVAMRAVR